MLKQHFFINLWVFSDTQNKNFLSCINTTLSQIVTWSKMKCIEIHSNMKIKYWNKVITIHELGIMGYKNCAAMKNFKLIYTKSSHVWSLHSSCEPSTPQPIENLVSDLLAVATACYLDCRWWLLYDLSLWQHAPEKNYHYYYLLQ